MYCDIIRGLWTALLLFMIRLVVWTAGYEEFWLLGCLRGYTVGHGGVLLESQCNIIVECFCAAILIR